mmetsp:Transcript_42275/g.99272  ORF Transcript_42275/g.99272 Transcript_42275/m.99272 type:complete len:86 (-) Transcript_42275:118-375(-)
MWRQIQAPTLTARHLQEDQQQQEEEEAQGAIESEICPGVFSAPQFPASTSANPASATKTCGNEDGNSSSNCGGMLSLRAFQTKPT